MTDRLAIIGAGGHGKVAADVARASGWRDILLFDDAWAGDNYRAGNWTVVGKSENIEGYPVDGVFVAVGDAGHRARLVAHVLEQGWPLVTLCAPSAVVSADAWLAGGVLVAPGAMINVDARVGEGAIINTGAIVEHDVQVGTFSHVCPGVALGGDVRVGDRSWIGIGATVRHGVRIGNDVMVGAGAVVVSDVADGLQVTGVPARARRN